MVTGWLPTLAAGFYNQTWFIQPGGPHDIEAKPN